MISKPLHALFARLPSTLRSVRNLWAYVIVAGSLVSFFGSAGLSLLIFEILIRIYRLPAGVIYDEIGWPGPMSFATQVRDLTTVLIVAVVAAAWKTRSVLVQYRARKAELDREAETVSQSSRQDEGGADVGGAIGGGALLGLILGGPLGALVGAGLGGIAGAVATAEIADDPPRPPVDREAALAATRRDGFRAVGNRFGFCLVVGLLMIGLDLAAPSLMRHFNDWDRAAVTTLNNIANRLEPDSSLVVARHSSTPDIASPPIPTTSPAAESVTAPTKAAKPEAAPARPAPVRPKATATSAQRSPATSGAPMPTEVRQPRIEPASVETYPDAVRLRKAYPPRAYQRRSAGAVTMRCWVSIEGAADGCVVLEEVPEGRGFGAAALGLAAAYRFKPQTSDGKPERGTIDLVVKFEPTPR